MNQKRLRGGRNGGRRPHNMGNTNRNYDSSGPDVKIRGTASQIYERYCQLARDANSSGDRIAAENYLQHAEHYYRIMLANGLVPQPKNGQNEGGDQPFVEGNAEQPAAEAAPAQPEAAPPTAEEMPA